VTAPDSPLPQYRAGLEAELALLCRLERLAARQREAATSGDSESLVEVTAARERVVAALLAIEAELRPLRLVIAAQKDQLEGDPHFSSVAALHRDAAARVASVLASDRESLDALRAGEAARRDAARAVEQGESTLAAYRRVVTPATVAATLVDRRG
jgi:hypothetical protein